MRGLDTAYLVNGLQTFFSEAPNSAFTISVPSAHVALSLGWSHGLPFRPILSMHKPVSSQKGPVTSNLPHATDSREATDWFLFEESLVACWKQLQTSISGIFFFKYASGFMLKKKKSGLRKVLDKKHFK